MGSSKRRRRAPSGSAATKKRSDPDAGDPLRWSRIGAAVGLGLVAVLAVYWFAIAPSGLTEQQQALRASRQANPRGRTTGNLTLHWDPAPDKVVSTSFTTSHGSNILPRDYVGPDRCRSCHEEQYASWSTHPHRWMNALATNDTVKGDFNRQTMRYLGGTATFYREAEGYRMRLERDGVRRVYRIRQTIGSRFFQYYIGTAVEAPEPADHMIFSKDHVLPLGYWLARKMWVPIVHVTDELPDDQRIDPFAPAGSDRLLTERLVYAERCSNCHTTFTLGDMCIRFPELVGTHAPARLHLSMPDYLAEARPDLWTDKVHPLDADNATVNQVIARMSNLEAPTHAVNLGISCEACHLGAREHASGKLKKPIFLPSGDHVRIDGSPHATNFARSPQNLNWVCSRCHQGDRPRFAAGMSTWNSTEFSDAARGSCYSQLTCVHCHNPHEATGPQWKRSQAEDDAVCLSCHQKFNEPEARRGHTHHAPGSPGDGCLNCHMPRLNEGIQDVVRTHTIFSPTNKKMLDAGQPNACNLCHLKEPIDWTLGYLKEWYGKTYPSVARGTGSGPPEPVGRNWLRHANESVRLVAVAAAARRSARWLLPEMIDMLDDDFLLNRQFAQQSLEQMLDVRLDAH